MKDRPGCLCCSRPKPAASGYHPRCLRALFGAASRPKILLRMADLPAQIEKAGGEALMAGGRVELPVRLNPELNSLETAASGATHVLKPEPARLPELPLAENLCMNMAAASGLRVPPHGLFSMADGRPCFVARRSGAWPDGEPPKAQTLFELLGAKDEYEGSVEDVGKAVRARVRNVGLDALDFFERLVFCFLIGQGDMHLRRWALLALPDGSQSLAPVSGLIPSKAYMPAEDDSALRINGKTNQSTPSRGS